MNAIKFRITSVDHYGYNGRDHHPDDTMIGLIAVPVSMSPKSSRAPKSTNRAVKGCSVSITSWPSPTRNAPPT